MSESERRRKYRYNRVLIDTERVLNPPYDDALVYLTAAQLEMLRNVTQYLNRLDTYVTEYATGYYLTPTAGDYDTILAIVADLEEILMGNPNVVWGYKDRLYEPCAIASVGAGSTYVSTTEVPAGYVHVIETWCLRHLAETTCHAQLTIDTGGNWPILYNAPALPSGEWVYQITNLTLKEGDTLRLQVVGLPNTKIANLYIWGHTMVVPE